MHNKYLTLSLAATVLVAVASAAIAAPNCEITTNGDKVKVTISDTGLVYRTDLKQSPPTTAVTYKGTGRKVDRTASCKDNVTLCNGATWFLRFADAKQGWPGDADIAIDPRVVPCTYDAGKMAQVCEFVTIDGMKTAKGDVRMHYSAKVADVVVAAYQPQAGCATKKDGMGNSHTVITATKP